MAKALGRDHGGTAAVTIWLLLIYVVGLGPHLGGAESIEFSTKARCEAARVAITTWLETVDPHVWGRGVEITCIEIEK